jgi:hypothetical protein
VSIYQLEGVLSADFQHHRDPIKADPERHNDNFRREQLAGFHAVALQLQDQSQLTKLPQKHLQVYCSKRKAHQPRFDWLVVDL